MHGFEFVKEKRRKCVCRNYARGILSDGMNILLCTTKMFILLIVLIIIIINSIIE